MELSELATRSLTESGLGVDQASIIADQLADHVRQRWGGQMIYFSQQLSARHEELSEATVRLLEKSGVAVAQATEIGQQLAEYIRYHWQDQ